MSTIVRLDNVIKTYGQGNVAVQALKGINLELAEGAFASSREAALAALAFSRTDVIVVEYGRVRINNPRRMLL